MKTREERTYPHVDDKVLTSWNALMIAGLAKAAKVYQEPKYLSLAKDAITFIENKLIIDGRVMVRYRDGEVKTKALSTITLFSYGLIWISMKLRLIFLIYKKRRN